MTGEKVGVEAVIDGMSQFRSDASEFNSKISGMTGAVQQGAGIMSGLGDIAKTAIGYAVGTLAVDAFNGLKNAVGDFFQQALAAEQQQAGLAAVLKSTNYQAGLTQATVNDLAQKFKNLAGGSDEAVVAIEEIGIRSGSINANTMPQFIQNVLDLGQVMGDTSVAATLLARAQEDPLAALGKLQKAGILFTAAQKEQIQAMVKAGDTAGATALIMQRVAEATGGAAAANADTLAGRWEIMSNELQDAGKGILTAVLPALEQLFDIYIKPNIPLIENFAATIANGLGPALDGLIGTITRITSGGTPALRASLQDWARSFIDWVAPMIPPLLLEVGKLEAQLVFWIVAQLPVWIAQLQAWGQQFVAWVAPFIPPLIVEAQKLAAQLLAWVQAQLPPLIAQLQAWGVQLWAWVAPMIPPLIAEAEKLANQLLAWLAAQIPPLIAQLLLWGQEFVNWVGPQIPPLLVELGKLLGEMTAWIITTGVPLLVEKISEWAKSFADWVMKPGGAKDQVLPALSSFLLAVGGFVVNDMVPGFIGFAKSFIDGLLSGFDTNLPTLIADVQGIGTAIINGIVAGINAAPGAILSALSAIVQGAIAQIKHDLGISSPSQVAADEIGQPFSAGIAQGILSGVASIQVSAGVAGMAMLSSTSSMINNYNYSPTYGAGPVNPSRDFSIMKALAT